MPNTQEGLFNYGGIAFDRLSIRDLSQNGHQPMISKDNQVMLAMNGEIYNADELRPELEKLGVIFKSNSDTEVLLKLYIKYGLAKALQKLDGAFALCIVDKKNNKIYLSRDRFGEKPLYI